MLLVFGSIFFVLLYISAVTGSLYIGMMGVAQIFLAFPPAILLYRFVFGFTYFGTLNMMAIFIILGIGADGACSWSRFSILHACPVSQWRRDGL